jgi:anti-sigma factor RsiW
MIARPHDRCRELLEQLSRYVDDDLAGGERRAMATHLKKCPCCQTMAESLQQTVEVCRKAGSARLPADVRARARRRIATLLASGPGPRRR